MSHEAVTGIYGKLPAHGDFIYRNLPARFINVWDGWLQGYVSSSQEQIGEQWLDVYLTSPIWRFALTSGVIDDSSWIGIMLPSVDRVGRYFPFSVARRIPPGVAPTVAMAANASWFEAVEAAALSALEGAQQIDELVSELDNFRTAAELKHRYVESGQSPLGAVVVADYDDQPVQELLPSLTDVLLRGSMRSYSVWNTVGSALVDPCIFYSGGLPQRRGLAAMLDGDWERWGWQVPLQRNITTNNISR